MKLTAGGYEDSRAACPCRHNDPPRLCAQCEKYGLVLLLKDGFGPVLARLEAKERSLLKLRRQYIKGGHR